MRTNDLEYWKEKVRESRRSRSVYVHAACRSGLVVGNIRFSCRSYGRSLQAGGHKYKAYAEWADTGKPVPSIRLGIKVQPRWTYNCLNKFATQFQGSTP